MSAKVSIIVPVYNTETYLSCCIDSILSQSFTDFELLLVDDGSTDGSGKICDAYAEKDSRIRVFHKKNGGVSSARNMGLDNAKGEWVFFVDSDDELMPDGLKTMAGMACDGADMVMAGYETFDEEGNKLYAIETRTTKRLSALEAAKEMFAPMDYRYMGYIWSRLFRHQVIQSNHLRLSEQLFFNEDRLFVTQFICAAERYVVYTTEPFYKYFEHAGSAMMSLQRGFNPKFVTDLQAQAEMRNAIWTRFDEKRIRELCDYAVYQSYRRIIGMMESYHVNDKVMRKQMRSSVRETIGMRQYFKFETQRVKRRAKSLIGKLLKN